MGTIRGEGDPSDPEQDQSWRWGRKFRAYDKATGDVVWETELPAGTTGGPMTYLHEGRQYIVVAVGVTRRDPRVGGARAAVGFNRSLPKSVQEAPAVAVGPAGPSRGPRRSLSG